VARALRLCALLVLALPVCAQTPPKPPKPPAIKASAAILIDAVSGQVLYAKNPDRPRPPASTTKIMTAILLLENTQPDDLITAGKRAVETPESSLHLKVGEKITARDMLYAILLRSANDGCVAIAEHVAGSVEKFAALMNQKAKEIGAVNTAFRNPHGLNDPPNRTTARDLALMARYASRYAAFNEATRAKFYYVTRTHNQEDILLKNHAKFLWKFPGADGVKTGYTRPAGRCFVGAATWKGWRLISVVLNSPNVVEETARLMKYGFHHFEAQQAARRGEIYANVPVRQGRLAAVPAAAQETIQYVTPKGQAVSVVLQPRYEPVNAPVAEGAVVGTLEAYRNGRPIGRTALLAACAVEPAIPAEAGGGFSGGYILLAMLGLLVVGYGTAFTKTARFGRNRLAARLRGPDRRR